jgi:hypothetical protein
VDSMLYHPSCTTHACPRGHICLLCALTELGKGFAQLADTLDGLFETLNHLDSLGNPGWRNWQLGCRKPWKLNRSVRKRRSPDNLVSFNSPR